MESSSEINQSCLQGYLTPPRSKIISEQLPSIPQFKLLTNSELKRRFSPIPSSNKKRRYNPIRKTDSLVPLERNLNIPMIFENLFDHKDDSMVPFSSSKPSKIILRPPMFDCFMSNGFKIEQENIFSISESIMKEKLKILLEKH